MRTLLFLAVLHAATACGDSGAASPSTANGGATQSGAGGAAGEAGASGGAAGASGGAAGAAGGAAGEVDPLLGAFGIKTGCDVSGSPFGHAGSATIRGKGTLPAGLVPGDQLNMMIGNGGVQYGVLGENLFDITTICDSTTFDFEITKVEAGQWTLQIEVLDPDQPDDALASVYEAKGDVTITVADGETVEQDVRFDTP
jgi:hypothetical protein